MRGGSRPSYKNNTSSNDDRKSYGNKSNLKGAVIKTTKPRNIPISKRMRDVKRLLSKVCREIAKCKMQSPHFYMLPAA